MPDLLAMSTLKKHWALVPVVGICGAACVMCGTYVAYMSLTKSDLSWKPRSWNSHEAPYQSVKPEEIKKFIKHSSPNAFDPEIEALKRELGSYKS